MAPKCPTFPTMYWGTGDEQLQGCPPGSATRTSCQPSEGLGRFSMKVGVWNVLYESELSKAKWFDEVSY
jgi:hypothetical protein